MNKSSQWKLLTIIIIAITAVWLIWPPFSVKDQDGKVIQKGRINLGLDLQGGMHIVLRVDTSKVPLESRKDAVDRAMEIIRNRVDQFGVGEMAIQLMVRRRAKPTRGRLSMCIFRRCIIL